MLDGINDAKLYAAALVLFPLFKCIMYLRFIHVFFPCFTPNQMSDFYFFYRQYIGQYATKSIQ